MLQPVERAQCFELTHKMRAVGSEQVNEYKVWNDPMIEVHTFATCVVVVFDVEIALVISEYRSFITMKNTFPFLVCGIGPSLTIAISSRGSVAGSSYYCGLRFNHLRLRVHVPQLLIV